MFPQPSDIIKIEEIIGFGNFEELDGFDKDINLLKDISIDIENNLKFQEVKLKFPIISVFSPE
jgi:hypothetical protein